MAHKILMLGGFRAGKSSILASILYSAKQVGNGLFSIIDNTDYTGAGAPVSLDDKRIEVSQYIKNKGTFGQDEVFLVDMNQTRIGEKSTYTLTTRIDGTAGVNFDFVDVSGEWMRERSNEYNKLKDEVKECDVFVIAIDTPYMMQEDGDINDKYNRITEITKVLDGIVDGIDMSRAECFKKMIIFCPVKCEKWVRACEADKVSQKVRLSYKQLINKFCNNSAVEMRIMPIQTVGAIEFAEMHDAYRYFSTPEDKEGIECLYYENSDMVRTKHGEVISDITNGHLEKDGSQSSTRDALTIQWAWYKKTGAKYEPVDCEQPMYHILRFLVQKEIAINQSELEKRKNESWWLAIYHYFVPGPFQQYIDQYRKVVDSLDVRESGKGFMKIREKVE